MNGQTHSGLVELSRDILNGARGEAVTERLESLGFDAGHSLANHFESLARRFCADTAACGLFASVVPAFLRAPLPAEACLNLLRYLDTGADARVLLETLSGGAPQLEVMAVTFGSSRYMADILIRNPGLIHWLLDRRAWERADTPDECIQDLRTETGKFGTFQGKLGALKRFHRTMLFKVGVLDLLGVSGLEDVVRRLSDLAAAIVTVALEIVLEDAVRDRPANGAGRPDDRLPPGRRPESGFAVVAMGKLGGRELNYSSDIDLIYVCEDAGDESLAFFRGAAERLTAVLSEPTDEGYLYRVDLRLRPDGESGPLVNTLESMRIYYETRGKPWEFQAFLKARVIAGDPELGGLLLERVSNLMFNPSLYYSPIETISLSRARIQEAISGRDRVFNIKLMEGGIRDIEFIVQTVQLLHAAVHRDIRTPNTMDALAKIRSHALLKEFEADALLEAYGFLRLVEHRLQMMHQIKTHSVPETSDDIQMLARRVSAGSLGPFTGEKFLETLSMHLTRVRVIAERFFSGEAPPETSLLLILPRTDERVRSILDRYGLADTARIMNTIHAMAFGSFPRLLDRRTRAAFERLLPPLLEDVARTGDPGRTLVNIARIAAASGNEYALYRFLADESGMRRLLVSCAGLSSVFTGVLGKNPDVLEHALLETKDLMASSLEPPSAGAPFAGGESDEAASRLGDSVRALARAFDRLRLGAFVDDLKIGSLPQSLQAHTTLFTRNATVWLAERLLDAGGVALFALGSHGVGEPRLQSDVDILVAADFTRTSSDRETLIKRLQRLNTLVSEATVFKLDFRLRGEGENAPLVQEIEFYKNYFESRMSPWERIGFAKCRLWFGDAAVADEFFRHLSTALARPFTREELEALRATRRKLEAKVPASHALWETKRSAGGRYDIEYLCGVALASAVDAPPYPFSLSTAGRLAMAERAGLIDSADLDACLESLRLFERIEYLLELQGFTPPHAAERRHAIARYMERSLASLGMEPPGGIEHALGECKRRVRECFEKVFHAADR